MNVKVYGIQRSGNNWLMWMLAANYRVKVLGNTFGWTHGPINPDAGADVSLIISKHPLAWLPSMYRFAKNRGDSFAGFVKRSKCIEDWNARYAGYLKDAEKVDGVFLRYEDLLENDPEMVLDDKIVLERKPGAFRTARGHAMGKHMQPTEKRFDASEYLQKKYLNRYTQRILDHAVNRFDWGVAESLGYDREGVTE